MTTIPVLSPDILCRIDKLRATRPYDGRRVVLMENRGGWKWSGIRGVCTRLPGRYLNHNIFRPYW